MHSLWLEQNDLPTFPPLQETISADVAVIGGGIAGILCAWRLRELGLDCVLLESGRICRGATGHTTAKLTVQHGLVYQRLAKQFGLEKARQYLAANLAALDQFKSLCAHIDCNFQEQDSFVYSRQGLSSLEAEQKILTALNCPATLEKHLPLPFSAAGALRLPRQAQFDPLAFLSALLPGLRIFERSPVRALKGAQVITKEGAVHARQVIVATHFPFLDRHGLYFMKLYQSRSYVLALENAPLIDGMFIDETPGGLSFRTAGPYQLLGGGGGRTGKENEAWAHLESFARRHWPQAKVKYRWAAQDCMSLDGAPYIGPYSPNTPNVYVATGFNKWGMTSAMAAALILGDLLTGRENPWAEVFSPQRTMLRPQLAVNAAASAAGLLNFRTPRCPHMGCGLKWNDPEHTWDCPCHGSRFSEAGERLDGPANGDLPNA